MTTFTAPSEVKDGPKKPKGYPFKLVLYCFTLYISGIVSFFVVISEPYAMQTYYSDNSLMPGMVDREFTLETEAKYYLRDLTKLSKFQNGGTLSTSPATVTFIKKELTSLGLEAFEQRFTFEDSGSQVNGTNLYTIIESERSTGAEAMVLCAPYHGHQDTHTFPGIALSLALAKYFSSKSYWAKDIIILFVDHRDYGTAAWLNSYHLINQSKYFNQMASLGFEKIYDKSGPIHSAIVLDLHSQLLSRVNVKIQGEYGQLPNLDLVNLVVESSIRENVTPFMNGKSTPVYSTDMELLQHHSEAAYSFITNQATMRADGIHGQFMKFAIQSLTIEGPKVGEANKYELMASLLNVGRLVEGVFRSLNNMTERFNRSFYFYIIVALRRFVPVSHYMIPLGLMAAPTIIKALHHEERDRLTGRTIGIKTLLELSSALVLSILSVVNISTALIAATVTVPVLILL